jgi:hypothetical protein
MRRALVAAMLVVVLVAVAAAQEGARRVPLTKDNPPLRSPTTYHKRMVLDSKSGREVEFDPKPTVTPIDAREGRYALRWIGGDGKPKTIVYQRDDKIDAIVAADVLGLTLGAYRYGYKVRVLATSAQPLARLVVQNFAGDASPSAQANLHIGTMTNRVSLFSDGHWQAFAPLPAFRPTPKAGVEVTFELESKAPPALVGCRVAGRRQDMVGVGEEPPSELMDALPGYNAWPYGYTIGPDDRLKPLSPAQRAAKLVEWLPEFERQGWITAERRRHYEASARRGDLKGLAGVVDADLRAEQITTEVRAIVLGLADLLGK